MEENKLLAYLPLLEIACCPYSKSNLTLMSLSKLHQFLPEEKKAEIQDEIIGALVSDVSLNAYPIIGSVVSFLEQDVIKLSEQTEKNSLFSETTSVKQEVKQWYDEFGWKTSNSGIYNDTALFSQTDQTAHAFYEINSHLQFLDKLLRGKFLLDAASGAIAHPEYLAYSWFYQYRICVDISLTALKEAALKIGNKGFFIMADIYQLPFQDNVFDGVISGYTIQHIPEIDQRQSVRELYRVLAVDKWCLIMTDIRRPLSGRLLKNFFSTLGKLKKQTQVKLQENEKTAKSKASLSLYCHLQELRWWKDLIAELHCYHSINALRIFTKGEFEKFFDNSLLIAKLLRFIEIYFPQRVVLIFCRYVVVSLKKTATLQQE